MPSSTSTVGSWNCAESCSIKPTVIVRSNGLQGDVAAMKLPLEDVKILTSPTPWPMGSCPNRWGQPTDEVLQTSLRMSEADIAALRQAGVIGKQHTPATA
jgi:hypothetical protein